MPDIRRAPPPMYDGVSLNRGSLSRNYLPYLEGLTDEDNSVAFTVPGSDLFPYDLFHLRRGLVGGSLARAWISFRRGATIHVVDFAHGGSSADPTLFVPSLSSAIRTTVDLGSTTRTAAQVATAIVTALNIAGVTGASAIGDKVTIENATNLMIPPPVDLTDTSLRGMWGAIRDDWGDGGAGQTLNQNGGTNGIGSTYIGSPGAGRIIAVYVWGHGGFAPRLAVSRGQPYSPAPGALDILAQGVVSAGLSGIGGIAFEAIPIGAADDLWAHYRDDAVGGVRYRAHGGTPVGSGTFGVGQVLVWDTSTDPSAATPFGATYTSTADATFNIYVSIGIVAELPDGSGNYFANGALMLRVGDQDNNSSHGTQFLVAPATLDGETTHHRQYPPQWTAMKIVSVTRTIDALAADEDSRGCFYQWDDLNLPSTTPATLLADVGPLNLQAGSATTKVFAAPIPIGTETIGANATISVGFNYTTDSGAALATYVLPVFLDAPPGDSNWFDCWEDTREGWHDDIRGASGFPGAGVTEYRTTVAGGNLGMPTTIISQPWPNPMSTAPGDDSPSAIALDWYIIERKGIVAA